MLHQTTELHQTTSKMLLKSIISRRTTATQKVQSFHKASPHNSNRRSTNSSSRHQPQQKTPTTNSHITKPARNQRRRNITQVSFPITRNDPYMSANQMHRTMLPIRLSPTRPTQRLKTRTRVPIPIQLPSTSTSQTMHKLHQWHRQCHPIQHRILKLNERIQPRITRISSKTKRITKLNAPSAIIKPSRHTNHPKSKATQQITIRHNIR